MKLKWLLSFGKLCKSIWEQHEDFFVVSYWVLVLSKKSAIRN
jgi:hypothetical protein